MAATGRPVGQYLQSNRRFVSNVLEQLRGHRSFGCTAALRQQAVETSKEATESIVIPRKKTWCKEAVLEALASTVSRDPTAYPYLFQDDSYLSPRNTSEFKSYYLSLESGRSAAKYFINNNPKFFMKDFAEPHIPCLMPETVTLLLEEVSEEALKERINLRKVTAAVDVYDQLVQAGTAVSMEITHDLLDLICFYNDRDPDQDTVTEEQEADSGQRKWGRIKFRRDSDLPKTTWKENNNAERIFNLLPERDTRCYSALIRGMVKHEAYGKAFSMHTDMLNNRLNADVHTFNALITAAPKVFDAHTERWDLITKLLVQMNEQKVQPNLMTFNSVLKALRHSGSMAKSKSVQILSEMKAVGIAPTLASYDHILAIFQRSSLTEILQEIMSELEGKRFTCQDPGDVMFFASAMKTCLDNKDLELGYKIHNLVEVGENWRLLGDPYQRSIYYGRFLKLLCLMEHIDVVLKWYRQLIPSVYYPNPQGLKDLLQALDTDGRLDLLPSIWEDICSVGHDNKLDLVEDILSMMAREKHSPEVQGSFGVCALDIKKVINGEKGRPSLTWSALSLLNVSSLLLRANMVPQAWEILQLFKSNNKVPPEELLNEFLTACLSDSSPQRAVDLVQLSAAFFLPETSKLLKRTLAEFDLTKEQRALLSELDCAGESD